MSRQKVPVQVNQFIGGLNTEANPLAFPENNSIDENNVELTTKGTRIRRDGFDVEHNYAVVDTTVVYQNGVKLGRSQFRWENPGGDASKQFLIIQIGNYLAIHNADSTPISSSIIYSFIFNTSTYSTDFSYSSVDGHLVVVTGLKSPSVFSYNGSTITKIDPTILTRDLWGVEAIISGVNLTDPSYTSVRPSSSNPAHLYNLRNQTFALPRVEGDSDTETIIDPIGEFNGIASTFPSNADSITQFLVADANKSSNRTVERFNAMSMLKTPPGSTQAAKGYFIIDALSRGASRNAQETLLRSRHPVLGYSVGTLPTDVTPGGPTVTASYAGRAWFSGFSGVVTNGDNLSPHLDSYVFFSKLVQNKKDIARCYQEGDPTSNLDPDIVDTDGGFIKIEGVGSIKALVPLGASLFVLANNGVWRIVGRDENSFTATEYSVSKVTNDGCSSAQSVVVVTNGVFYWGEDGIYMITQSEAGDWIVQNLTRDSIQTYYMNLNADDKRSVVGYYDASDPSVRWIFGNGLQLRQGISELILNLRFKAFTKNDIGAVSSIFGPLTAVGGVNRIRADLTTIQPKQSFYVIVVTPSPTLRYTFGGYKPSTILDWSSVGGIDVPAYIIAGAINKGSARLRKDVPYLTTFFEQTATEGSCFVQAQWDWTNNSLAGRWSLERQAYRPARVDIGQTMVVTRNKIRGGGKVVAFKFTSETDKPFHLYGWEFNLEAVTDE